MKGLRWAICFVVCVALVQCFELCDQSAGRTQFKNSSWCFGCAQSGAPAFSYGVARCSVAQRSAEEEFGLLGLAMRATGAALPRRRANAASGSKTLASHFSRERQS